MSHTINHMSLKYLEIKRHGATWDELTAVTVVYIVAGNIIAVCRSGRFLCWCRWAIVSCRMSSPGAT